MKNGTEIKCPTGLDISKVLFKMKLLSLILLFIGPALSASGYTQVTRFSFNFNNETLAQVIKQIEENSEFIFFYDEEQWNLNTKVSLNVKEETLDKILTKIIDPRENSWKIYDRQVVITRKVKEGDNNPEEIDDTSRNMRQQQQQRLLTGRVVDNTGMPLPGVSVYVKGTTIGISTTPDGLFSINVPADAQILVFSFIGMETVEQVIGPENHYNITMEWTALTFDEVVVVGYGQQKKVTVTGAVSSVSNKELVQTPVANISNALAGRVTGVLAMQRSGEPGNDQSQLRIRGVGTFAGSQEPLVLVDGIETDNYNNIDAHEIESITILKDASSTAVYGVRGANGVILITTRRGETGKPTISFSSNIAGTSFVDYIDRLDSYRWATSYNEALAYDSYVSGAYNPFWSEEELNIIRDQSDPIFFPNSDWPSLMYRDLALQHQHNLNMRGGTQRVKYFASIGHFNQEGHFNNTNLLDDFFDQQIKYQRYNFRTNFDFQVTNRFSIDLNLSAQVEDKRSFANTANNFIRYISIVNPLQSPGVVDGRFIEIPSSRVRSLNPIAELYGNHVRNHDNQLNGSMRLNYDLDFIADGLKVHSSFSYQNFNRHGLRFSKPIERFSAIKNEEGETVFISNQQDGVFSTSQNYGKRRQIYAEIGLNYSQSFGNHNVSGLLLYNQTKRHDPDLAFLIPSGYQGLVGRVTYDFRNRYMVEYNAGYNGTENFAPGNRFGYFPAYSLGWIISEESFFPKNDYLTFVKLRGSYGEVGNDRIGGERFLYLPNAYELNDRMYHFGYAGVSAFPWPGAYEGKIGNPNLTWERARKSNFGTELTFFDDRLRITADRFFEKRDNILAMPQTVPDISGMGNNLPAVNLGIVENSGYDGDISFRSRAGRFNYWVRANYTFAKNILIYQDEVPNPYTYQLREGQAIGQIFGLVDDGLYNTWEDVSDAYRPLSAANNNFIQPGDIRWKDINGDGIVDSFDEAPVGSSQFPDRTFGFSFGGDYRGFDFSILFQGANGITYRGVLNMMYIHYNEYGSNAYLYDYAWTHERYEQGGDIRHPRIYHGLGVSRHNDAFGTFNMADASYIRLRNAEIGYRLQRTALDRIGIESIRFYLNGSNLFTWSPMLKKYPGVDPEDYSLLGSGLASNTEPYPRVRVFNFGMNVNF
jgi:TonB-linked SusC/RagA family outer membrane protein